jgi:hypothetical protein
MVHLLGLGPGLGLWLDHLQILIIGTSSEDTLHNVWIICLTFQGHRGQS